MKIKLDSFLLSTITTKHIAITGGGGKTSLMIFLSRVLATQNKSVLISTTTKVIRPDKMDYGVEKVFLEPFHHSLY